MPLSRPEPLPRLINLVWETNPQSILDVGIGFGAIGVLFRQTADIRWGRMNQWKTVLHGIEIFPEYRNPIWQYVYNNVYIGDAVEVIPQLPQDYDLVFMGDVVEHLEPVRANALIELGLKKAKRYLVISTPADFRENADEARRFGNSAESHRSAFSDLKLPSNAIVEQYGGQKLIIIPKT